MPLSNVISIASLDTLKSALDTYSEQSLVTVQGFASILAEKLEYLKSLEKIFVERVRAAEAALRSCEIGRASDPPNDKRSCSSEERALSRARANYAQYKAEMARIAEAFTSYKNSEAKYSGSLNEIKAQTIPKLGGIIETLSDYFASDNEVISNTRVVSENQNTTDNINNTSEGKI